MVKIPGLPSPDAVVRVQQTDKPNDELDSDVRAGTSKVTNLSDGPKLGTNGEYLPARYKDQHGNIVEDR